LISHASAPGVPAQPAPSDLMIVAKTVTLKMAPVLKRLYDQMQASG
jgi:NADH:ubiquinone oxidoreductase subunit B-like Fe-S oxidoreductase